MSKNQNQPKLTQHPLAKGLHKNVAESYNQFLNELREDIDDGETSEFLSSDFQDEFKILINSSELDFYTPKHYYWLNIIDSLINTLGLLEDDDLGIEEIIEYFENTEYLGFILDEAKENEDDPFSAVKDILSLQELQVISFFHLHISNKTWKPGGPVAYQPIQEIGEGKVGLYLGEENHFYPLPDDFIDQTLPVISYDPKKKELILDQEDETLCIYAQDTLCQKTNDAKLSLQFVSEQQDESLIDKLNLAYERLNELCPQLVKILNQYTQFICPIDTKELVSFSMNVLPTYSSINMYDRDEVDLVDDLIHENGHHYLNAILEGETQLIHEDSDKIFFSPWRAALRPVRGIIHGTLTFYWAWYLFKSLSINEKSCEHFTAEQMQKIYYRALEEKIMMLACQSEIEKAYKLDKITDECLELCDFVMNEIKSHTEEHDLILSKLNQEGHKRLSELNTHLAEKRDLLVN